MNSFVYSKKYISYLYILNGPHQEDLHPRERIRQGTRHLHRSHPRYCRQEGRHQGSHRYHPSRNRRARQASDLQGRRQDHLSPQTGDDRRKARAYQQAVRGQVRQGGSQEAGRVNSGL